MSTAAQGRSKAKRARFERNERLRANRRDPELERLARTRKCEYSGIDSRVEGKGLETQLAPSALLPMIVACSCMLVVSICRTYM